MAERGIITHKRSKESHILYIHVHEVSESDYVHRKFDPIAQLHVGRLALLAGVHVIYMYMYICISNMLTLGVFIFFPSDGLHIWLPSPVLEWTDAVYMYMHQASGTLTKRSHH